MKKIVLIVILLVLAAVGYTVFSQNPAVNSLKESLVAPLKSSVPGADQLETLPPTTIASFYLVGSEVKKSQDTAQAYFEKMRNTQVWKTLGVDAQVDSIKKQIFDNMDPAAAGTGASLGNSVDVLWKALDGGFSSVSSNLDAKDNSVTVQYSVALNSADQKNQIITTIISLLKNSNGKVEQSDAAGATVRFGTAPSDVLVKIASLNDTTVLTTATVTGVDTSAVTALQAADRKKIVELASLENTVSYYVVKQNSFNKLFPVVLKRVSETAFPQLAPSLGAVSAKLEGSDNVDTTATVLSMSPAIRAKTCSTSTGAAAATASSDLPDTLKLISSRSPGFVSTTTDNLLRYLKTALAASSGTENKDAAQASQDLESLKKAVENLHLKEISVASSIPINGVTPHYGFVFTTSQAVTLSDFAGQLKDGLSTLKSRYPDENIPTFAKATDSTINLDLGNGSVLEGRSLNPTTIMFSETPAFFDEISDTLKRDKPFLSSDRIKASGISELLKSPAVVAYLSTSSLMPLARQFAPFLSMLNPKARLTDQDYTEFLSLIEFSGLYAESAPETIGGISCSVSGIGLLKMSDAPAEKN